MVERFVLPEITVRPPEEEPPPPPPGPAGGTDAAPTVEVAPPVFRGAGGRAQPPGNPPPPPPESEPPSLPSDDNILLRGGRSAYDMLSGESSQPDDERYTPEWLQSDMFSTWQKAGLSVVAAGSPDPKALEDAVLARLPPGAKIETDVQGNRMVVSGGKKAYLNKPGISGTDALGIAGLGVNLAAAHPLGRIAALGGRTALNTILRSVIQAGGQAGAEAVKSGASVAGGSKQGIDLRQIAEGAVGGALGEPALAISNALTRGLGRSIGRIEHGGYLAGGAAGLPDATPLAWDQINASGRRALQAAGYHALNLPPDFTLGTMRRWSAIAPTFGTRGFITSDPETARRTLLEARFQTPFTLGQRTGDPAQLSREDLIRQGGIEPAKTKMGQFSGGAPTQGDTRLSTQQLALRDSIERMAGADSGAAAGDLQANLKAMAAQMDADTTAAYGRVQGTTGAAHRELPYADQVNFNTNVSQDVYDALRASGTSIINPASEQATRHVANLLESVSDPGAVYGGITKGGSPTYPPRLKPFNLGDYNETRRKLTDLYGSVEDATSQKLIRGYVKALDDAVDNAVTQGGSHMTGNPTQVARLKEARDVARAQFERFAPDNPEVAYFLNRLQRPGVSARDVADMLIGQGNIGEHASTTQILHHLETFYKPGSAEHDLIRTAFKHQMIFGNDATKASMGVGNMTNRFSRALEGRGKDIMAGLLTPAEIEEAKAFRDTLAIMQETGAQNTSKSAYKMADFLRGSRLNPRGWIFREFADQARAEREVARATAGQLPAKMPTAIDAPLSLARRTLAPVAGAAAGERGYVQPGAQVGINAALHPVDTATAAARGVERGLLHFYNWDK